jgi:hypothetical protein
MNPRARRVVWAVAAATGVLATVATLLINARQPVGNSSLAFVMVPTVAYGVVGSIIVLRRPGNAIGWIFFAVWFLASTGIFSTIATHAAAAEANILGFPETAPAPYPGGMPWWFVPVLVYSAAYWGPLLMLATVFTFLLFPDGPLSHRWRVVVWIAAAVTVVGTMIGPFTETIQLGIGADFIANPLPVVTSWPVATWIPPLFGITAVGCAVLSVVTVVLRWRRSSGVQRLQLRWFLAAVVAVAIGFLLTYHNTGANAAFGFTVSLIPIACGMAVFRYRLYDIDRIISRTASYAIVTGVLLATYAAIVTSVTRLLPDSSTLAVAAATLVAAALARPLYRRVQQAIDRRFNRARYDAQLTVDEFGLRLRHEVDTGMVTQDLVTVVHHTLQPEGVALWLRERS